MLRAAVASGRILANGGAVRQKRVVGNRLAAEGLAVSSEKGVGRRRTACRQNEGFVDKGRKPVSPCFGV